ncbi:MAG: alpha-amylase family protein [Candidatus Ventricola sp.]
MTRRITEPLMTLWFGNFYRPAFDDRAFIDQSVRSIRDMGFNCIQLDSKAWEDFRARFAGGEASDYVAQQEYMMEAIHREGLAHSFMALYLNGDNLYPNIRFSPPIYGESVVRADGSDGRWYRYWSEAAQDSQRDHVAGLMRLYREGHAQTENGLPICSMWDPIVAPSFDEEGQQRYKTWLKARYGDIRAFNAAYRTDFASFDLLTPQDYWFTVRHGEGSCYALADLRGNTPAFVMWADNMRWQADELTAYFAAMKEKLHAVDPALYLAPNMAQWSHLLNIDTSRKSDIGLCELWDTAMRGISMRALAPHVDMCYYYTVPVTIDGDPDAYVVSCQHAHIRSLNPGRPFLGGVYWGRFLYNDVYRYVTPEEIVGSITASGASGISAYGYGGMDDGGLLHRMDEGFCGSLTRANAWAKAVMPRLGRRRQSRTAILFPTAMALLEPLRVEGADARRLDWLGLYRQCCDLGFAPDIVEAEDVRLGLDGYDVLLIAADDCCHAQRDARMEEALRGFVSKGGVVIHGQHGEAAELAFGLTPQETRGTCYTYAGEGGLLLGAPYVSYPGETLAAWREDGKACISRMAYGEGAVYSFGFMPGYQYAARTAPHVPLSQRNNALYPYTHMEHNPLAEILLRHAQPDAPMAMKDVECAVFERGTVVVNHRSTPVRLPGAAAVQGQQRIVDGMLPAHSAAVLWEESV